MPQKRNHAARGLRARLLRLSRATSWFTHVAAPVSTSLLGAGERAHRVETPCGSSGHSPVEGRRGRFQFGLSRVKGYKTVRSVCKRELVFLLRSSLGVSAPGHMVNLSGRVRNGQTVFQRDCTTSHPRQPRASMPALHVLASTWRCHC